MATEPPAPNAIPQYLVDGLHRQNKQSLAAIEEYAAELRAYREEQDSEPLDESELADKDEKLVDFEDSDSGTIVEKKVPCGKSCGGCPHGPYKYTVKRVDGGLEWEYHGLVSE